MESFICEAIRRLRLIQFHYDGNNSPGLRVVEPHALVRDSDGRLLLSAWFVRGVSESGQWPGFRVYRMEHASKVTMLEEDFAGPRREYNPQWAERFDSVLCRI